MNLADIKQRASYSTHAQEESGMIRHRPPWPSGLVLPWLALLAATWAVASFAREQVDYPILRLLNGGARAMPLLDKVLVWTTAYHLLSGVMFVSLIWYCWFAAHGAAQRGPIVAGTVAAFLSGMVSRVLQLALPTHSRPMHDPALNMVLPAGVDPSVLNHWSSFPSDHAAVQFGLAAVVFMVRPRLGLFAFGWALFLNVSRIYLGVHYPTDVAGGAALGLLMVMLALRPAPRRAGLWLAGWETRAPAGFYLAAFFISYQIATLFDDLRTLAAAVLKHSGGGGV